MTLTLTLTLTLRCVLPFAGIFQREELVNCLKRHLNPKRLKAVKHAWSQLDIYEVGVVDVGLIRKCYSAHRHPEVLNYLTLT